MRKNSMLYVSCIRKCGRDTCKDDGICPQCYEKEKTMTPNPAKKSFEEKYQELVDRKADEYSLNDISAHSVASFRGFKSGATDPDLLRAVRLNERAHALRCFQIIFEELSPKLEAEGEIKSARVIQAFAENEKASAEAIESELEALLSGGGENG